MFARSVLRAAALPALASLAAAASAAAAPVPFGGNRYDVVFDDEITWTDAGEAATSAGGSLAVISSAEEQSFVQSLLLDRDAPTGSYWLGIRETDTEGQFETVNGEALTFSNFFELEPNDGPDGPGGDIDESVGSIYWTADDGDAAGIARRGTWNDLPEEGYPSNGVTPAQRDLFRAGYLVEFAGLGNGDGDGDGDGDGGAGGGDGNGGGGGDGDGDGDGGGGGATPIPIPAAALTFPGTAMLAYFASRRLRRR